jgi:hypothetical protein
MESNDDDENEHLEGDDEIMEFDGLMNMEQSDLPMAAIVGSNDNKFINPNGKGFCKRSQMNVKKAM